MSDATGAPTQNYTFKRLAGNDIAGFTSINAIVTSVDEALNNHFVGMILLLRTGDTPPVNSTGGPLWDVYRTHETGVAVGDIGGTNHEPGYPSAPNPPDNHYYIIKI